MTDIFENTILCKRCNLKMKPAQFMRNGLVLRAVVCEKCGNKIVHPDDEKEYNNFVNLKKKDFHVKMRIVGNSYAVSIPKEIVDFMHEQERIMNDMVKLCFEDFDRISLVFNDQNKNKEDIKN